MNEAASAARARRACEAPDVAPHRDTASKPTRHRSKTRSRIALRPSMTPTVYSGQPQGHPGPSHLMSRLAQADQPRHPIAHNKHRDRQHSNPHLTPLEELGIPRVVPLARLVDGCQSRGEVCGCCAPVFCFVERVALLRAVRMDDLVDQPAEHPVPVAWIQRVVGDESLGGRGLGGRLRLWVNGRGCGVWCYRGARALQWLTTDPRWRLGGRRRG